jgi:hypothetical protein
MRRSQRKKCRNEVKREERRRRSADFLRVLGLRQLVAGTPFEHQLLDTQDPRPCVVAADTLPKSEQSTALLKELNELLREVRFDCPVLGPGTSADDYFVYVWPIVRTLLALQDSKVGSDALMSAVDRLAPLVSTNSAALAGEAALTDLCGRAAFEGEFDGGHFFVTWAFLQRSRERCGLEFKLNFTAAEEITVTIDGEPRRAFRCGGASRFEGIKWAQWPPEIAGFPSSHTQIPVYVQRHVVTRLEERLNIFCDGAWLIDFCLWNSLSDPKIVESPGSSRDPLIEYRLFDKRVGYLPYAILDDKVVVRTFLFLTMDGTPEGARLRSQLRLRRDDKEYLELDTFYAFVHSDLKQDPDLVRVLSECGCGQLFEVPMGASVDEEMKGYAAEVRKFLRMEKRMNPAADLVAQFTK